MIEMRVHESMSDIARSDWDSLAGPGVPPFLSHAFLDALERAGCVTPERGWLPMHLTFWEDGRMIAAAPAYVKGNSEGEFVFDYGWADFAQRMRVRYYPKLILAVPFTPATGPRILVREGQEPERLALAAAEGVRRLVDANGISGAHVLFLPSRQAEHFEQGGFAQRWGVQYQWRNRGYSTFDDFLSTFSSKRRNQIRRERKEMERSGIRIATLRGADIDAETVELIYELYKVTVDKFRWGRRYLNRAFFFDVCERLRDNVEIVVARNASGRAIAGAFNLAGAGALYGRYWGTLEEHPFLHFNVCYYHSIEECIARKLDLFEPGAGGEHKRARGFDPTLTFSVHHLADPRIDAPIRDYLARERDHMQRVVSGEVQED